ncbi:MAG TPA: hypothetical protein VFR33_13070 [Candidatus Dormibacteraeota bacterium]|nr:hypothetical protein [Candidatus Dormibacteraeota bacterium]
MRTALELLGHVSSEGGPLLIIDFSAARNWTGVFGDKQDYQRLCDRLEASVENHGASVEVGGQSAVAWDMPTGTADIWRRSEGSVVLCRVWQPVAVDRSEYFAALPQRSDAKRLGKVAITGGWLVILWAAESGAEINTEPKNGKALDLSVGGAGLVAAMPRGDYVCYHDEIVEGQQSAQRCFVTRQN